VEERDLLREVTRVFERERKLVELPSRGKAVFVGDTHGTWMLPKGSLPFLGGSNTLVFLGDYVDRGEFSRRI